MDIWKYTATPQKHQNQVALFPLSQYAILEISGPDALTFLQGQCTCNMKEVSQQNWLLGAHCNPKGRMHSSFIVAQAAQNTFQLRLHKSILEHAQAALGKYAVFSRVELQPAQGIHVFALAGETTHLIDILKSLSGNNTISLITGSVISFPGGKAVVRQQELLEIWVDINALDALLKQIDAQVYRCDPQTGQRQWQLKMIALGQAEVVAESIEKLLPQELNFQFIDGISFNKGCYTGQEVIARLNYRASLKKHMYRAKINLTSPLTYGDPLLNSSAKKVGEVIVAEAVNSEGDYELLALINDDAQEKQSVVTHHSSSAILEWLPLPYAIT